MENNKQLGKIVWWIESENHTVVYGSKQEIPNLRNLSEIIEFTKHIRKLIEKSLCKKLL